MTTYIGLLRAVNVAGHNKVPMADLRELLVGLGMGSVRSLLQSGNLVFESRVASAPKLEAMLEAAAREKLGLETDFLVRTAGARNRIVADNPFEEAAERDPGHLLVTFLKGTPGPSAVTSLRKAIRGREVVQTKGPEAYIVYPDGIGRSRLTTRFVEERLQGRGTGRNWNTVLKLNAMASA